MSPIACRPALLTKRVISSCPSVVGVVLPGYVATEGFPAAELRARALTKWLVNRSLESDRAGAFYDESYAQELNMQTEDANEGVAAFVERRDPEFKGW